MTSPTPPGPSGPPAPRVHVDGVAPAPLDVDVRFEGRTIECAASDSIAAALLAAGERGLRETREGEQRGVFCGMGVCQECLVVVDGRPGVRACMTPVRGGMDIRRQPAKPRLGAVTARDARPTRHLEPAVLVIGGGPAGMAAAATAAEAGVDVVLVEERAKLGGQYFKQPAGAAGRVQPDALDAQFRAGRALADRVRRAGVRVLSGAEVWGIFGPGDIHVVDAEQRWRLRPRQLVLATGAYERGLPLPGWTLPGVLTTGAAQSLLRAHQVAPGRRVVISGNGPLNMQLAAELIHGGADVVALAELAAITAPARAGHLARMALASPGLMRDGARYRVALARARVPVLTRTAVVACHGDDRVQGVTLARIGADGRPVPGTERQLEADAVCLGFGFAPSNELARAAGVPHDADPASGALTPRRDADGRTPVDAVWIAGDAAGIGGSKVAQAAGTLAGAGAAAGVGAAVDPAVGRAARRVMRREALFQRALWQVFAAPSLVDELADAETPVCRCESVRRGVLDPLLADDVGHISALKRATRAGMGGCQGRYCAAPLAALAARASGRPLEERSGFAAVAPVKPTRIADLLED